ncbi:hypothetical protein KAZ82_01235 [Candidatus Babeliales bacterium]|nr:hypothetical protein [Candidatus Babeliales bacterium]
MKSLIVSLALISFFACSATNELSIFQNFQLWLLKQKLQTYKIIIQEEWTENPIVTNILQSAQIAIQKSSDQTRWIMIDQIIQLFKFICDIDVYYNNGRIILRKKQSHKKHTIKNHKKQPQNNQPITQKSPPKKIKGARSTKRKVEEQRIKKLQKKQEAERKYIQHLKELDNQNHTTNQQEHEFPTEYVYDLHHQIFTYAPKTTIAKTYPINNSKSEESSDQIFEELKSEVKLL